MTESQYGNMAMAFHQIDLVAGQALNKSVKQRIKALKSCRASYIKTIDEFYPTDERTAEIAHLDLRIQRALESACHGCARFIREHYPVDEQDLALKQLDARLHRTLVSVQWGSRVSPASIVEEAAADALDDTVSSDGIEKLKSCRAMQADYIRKTCPSEAQKTELAQLDIRFHRALESARVSRMCCIREYYPAAEHGAEFAKLDARFRQALALPSLSVNKKQWQAEFIEAAARAALGADKSPEDHVADLKVMRDEWVEGMRATHPEKPSIDFLDHFFRRAMEAAHSEYMEFIRENYTDNHCSDTRETAEQIRLLGVRFRRVMDEFEVCLNAPQAPNQDTVSKNARPKTSAPQP